MERKTAPMQHCNGSKDTEREGSVVVRRKTNESTILYCTPQHVAQEEAVHYLPKQTEAERV